MSPSGQTVTWRAVPVMSAKGLNSDMVDAYIDI
jgi:hypothetical protein